MSNKYIMKLFIFCFLFLLSLFSFNFVMEPYDISPLLYFICVIIFYGVWLFIANTFKGYSISELVDFKFNLNLKLLLLGLLGSLGLILIDFSVNEILFKLNPKHFRELSEFNVLILFYIIVCSFFEEILFRKFLISSLSKKYRPAKAILISALVFMIGHIFHTNFIVVFFSGLIYGYMYWISKSWFLCFVIHALDNSVIILLDELKISGFNFSFLEMPYYVFGMLLGISLLWYSLFLLKSKVKQLET